MATVLAELPVGFRELPERRAVIAERYEIERAIGRGGFSQVYRARHLGTGQAVALKILAPAADADYRFSVKRFFLEARVTAGLNHPSTVRVFDFGQEDSGVVYLAMELLSGQTLREALRSREMADRTYSEAEASALIQPVLRSLAEAHAAGLVHRDLKPDNLFLHEVAGERIVKVLDFGIAKLGAGGAHTLSSETSVPGTPSYMAPEHALNRPVDARSDLYALGVILYELVSGTLPFKGRSDPETLYQHAFQPVPPLREAAKAPLSAGFVAVVERALAKRPEDRFVDAEAMRLALSEAEGSAATDVRPSPTPNTAPASATLEGQATRVLTPAGHASPARVWGWGLTLLGIAAAGAWWWSQAAAPPPPAIAPQKSPTPAEPGSRFEAAVAAPAMASPPASAPGTTDPKNTKAPPLDTSSAPARADAADGEARPTPGAPRPRGKGGRRPADPHKVLLEQRLEDLVE